MKNDINLAYKRSADTKVTKGALIALLFIVLIGALAYAAVTIPNMVKAEALKKSAGLDTQLAALADTAQRFEEKTKIKQKLLENVDMLKELGENKKDVSALIGKIQAVCPQDITLTGIQFNPDGMSLSGQAKTDLEVSSFAFNLRGIEGFKSAMVSNSAAMENSDKQSFTVMLQFTHPLKAVPITITKEDNKNKAKNTNGSDEKASSADTADKGQGE